MSFRPSSLQIYFLENYKSFWKIAVHIFGNPQGFDEWLLYSNSERLIYLWNLWYYVGVLCPTAQKTHSKALYTYSEKWGPSSIQTIEYYSSIVQMCDLSFR